MEGLAVLGAPGGNYNPRAVGSGPEWPGVARIVLEIRGDVDLLGADGDLHRGDPRDGGVLWIRGIHCAFGGASGGWGASSVPSHPRRPGGRRSRLRSVSGVA